MNMEQDKLRGLPHYADFERGDLKVLEDLSSRRAAYYVWHDTVHLNQPQHAQKWAAMFSARALHSIAADSKRLKNLTRWLIALTIVLCVLTLVLCWDAVSRRQAEHQPERPNQSAAVE